MDRNRKYSFVIIAIIIALVTYHEYRKNLSLKTSEVLYDIHIADNFNS